MTTTTPDHHSLVALIIVLALTNGSSDPEARRLCLDALYKINTRTAKNALLRLYREEQSPSEWRLAIANISDISYMTLRLTETATGNHPKFAIVGLTASGKTTVFNTLTRGHAETGGFGGMELHVGVVKVPGTAVPPMETDATITSPT